MSVTHTVPKQRMKSCIGLKAAGQHEGLSIIVARLLAVALQQTECGQPQEQTLRWPLPARYRAWPMLESDLASQGCRRRLRCYVCPKAATVPDDEPFPVGTVLVVETYSMDSDEEGPHSRFVMGKYAGVTTGESDPVPYGAWASATYGPAGDPLPMDEQACGICRLPLE